MILGLPFFVSEPLSVYSEQCYSPRQRGWTPIIIPKLALANVGP